MVPAVTTTAIMTRTQTMPRILAVIAALWRTVVSAGQLGKKTPTSKVYNVNYISKGGKKIELSLNHKSKK